MVRIIVIGFWLLFPMAGFASGINQVRNHFHAIEGENDLLDFLAMAEGIDEHQALPYRIAASMQKAGYTANPFKKLKYFREGKEQLEAYIARHPDNVEVYYVRLLIQSEVPAFLGYNSEISHDIAFIQSHIDKALLPDSYKATMLANLNKITQKQQL